LDHGAPGARRAGVAARRRGGLRDAWEFAVAPQALLGNIILLVLPNDGLGEVSKIWPSRRGPQEMDEYFVGANKGIARQSEYVTDVLLIDRPLDLARLADLAR